MVEGHRKEKLVAELVAGVHRFQSGVSEKSGGHDEGPGPHELLEAALTACTIITTQMYADRKGWPLQSADVKVTIVKEGPETSITREIALRGELTQEARDRIIEIANKCPIHKLLESHVTITTNVVK
jgi:putative redox protein